MVVSFMYLWVYQFEGGVVFYLFRLRLLSTPEVLTIG
jgi:hypothetical protein